MLKEQNEELISSDLLPEQRRKRISLHEASRQILKKKKSQMSVRNVDTVKMKTEGELSPTKGANLAIGAVPLQKRNVVRQHKKLQSVDESTDAGLSQETRSPVVKQSAVAVEASLGVKPEKAADVPPQQKQNTSVASLQRQQWTEMSEETDSAEPKTKEEPLQEEKSQTVTEF